MSLRGTLLRRGGKSGRPRGVGMVFASDDENMKDTEGAKEEEDFLTG